MDPLRTLVVGAGFMGSLHARTVCGSRLARLCGVVDRNEHAAAAVGSELGVPGHTDLRRAIEETRPDVAIIATPDPYHREPAETAIDAGLAVLVEKPLATATADAEAIVAAAQARGVRLMAGHIGRFYPRYTVVADVVEAQEIGRPVLISTSTWGVVSLGARVSSTTNPLWHFAIHDIDLVQWITGGVIERVSGAHLVSADSGVSAFTATGVLSTGCAFSIGAGWTLPDEAYPRRDLKVHGDQGVAEATWRGDGVTVHTREGRRDPDCSAWPVLYGDVQGALRHEIEHFLGALIDDTPFAISTEEAVAAVRAAEALEQAAAA